MEPIPPPPAPPGRRLALVAFIGVMVGWVTGFSGLFWGLSHAQTDEQLRATGRLLGAVGTFALLCDLMGIIVGARALQRKAGMWNKARTFGIIAITLGALGISGALFLMLLGAFFKECGSCEHDGGCLQQLSGIGSAVAQ